MHDSEHRLLRWFFTLINTHHLAQAEVYGRIHQPVLTRAIFLRLSRRALGEYPDIEHY